MFYVKFQIACLAIILYVMGMYLHDSRECRTPRSRLFVALLVSGAASVAFDGATSWTVNHMQEVPAAVNLALHGAFFVCSTAVFVHAFLYMLESTVGLPSERRARVAVCLPGALTIVGCLAFLPGLEYIHGRETWYSMGVSVIVCYASMVAHFLAIVALVARRHRFIEHRKLLGVSTCLLLSFCTLFVQVAWPESLVSALFPAILVVGLYMNIENPSLKRLHRFNSTMITGFAALVESRDNSTGGHILRTKGYVGLILEAMRGQERYRDVLTRDYIQNVLNAAPMHDVGKIATPDRILQKPGRLTDEEFKVMKRHAEDGGEIIRRTFWGLDDPTFMWTAYEVARHHHEKWDGSGYPDGLAGENIPLHARIMAIADVFDAVSAKRCYRDAMPLDECFRIIEKGAGSAFDPELARLFLASRDEVERLHRQYG